MSGRRRVLATAVALAALGATLTACAEDAPGLLTAPASRVETDTPELRALKREAGVEPCPSPQGEPVEGGLPELALDCLGGGEPVDLAALRGPAVLQLWASWCGPCRRELPIFQSFHEEHGDRVRVLGVNTQDQMLSAALELLEETGATFPQVTDPGAELSAVDGLPVRGLPGVVLLDEQGRVAYRELREIRSADELEQLVADELGVRL